MKTLEQDIDQRERCIICGEEPPNWYPTHKGNVCMACIVKHIYPYLPMIYENLKYGHVLVLDRFTTEIHHNFVMFYDNIMSEVNFKILDLERTLTPKERKDLEYREAKREQKEFFEKKKIIKKPSVKKMDIEQLEDIMIEYLKTFGTNKHIHES